MADNAIKTMFNAATLAQVKAYARQEGIFLALVWMLSMWLTIRQPTSSWGGVLLLSTPFFVGWRLMVFRNNILGGSISFRRAYCFACYVFFYAALLFALGQYLYFRYLDNGAFLALLSKGIETMRPYYEQNNLSLGDLEMGMKMISLMNPIQLVLCFFMENLLIGAVANVFVALFCKKSKQ